MDFAKLFTDSRIVLGLESLDKDTVLANFVKALAENEVIDKDSVKEVISALLKREALGSTGIGRGIGIPHAKLKGLPEVVVAIATVPGGVDFNSVDGEHVNAIFLILSPQEDADKHVSILKWASSLVRNGDFRAFLQRAKSPAEAVALVAEMSEELAQ